MARDLGVVVMGWWSEKKEKVRKLTEKQKKKKDRKMHII